jgi:hypothetical protein
LVWQIVASKEGKLGIKKGSEPINEVLSGTNVTQFVAVADDLSLFGGVDNQKRLWVQHGFGAKAEIIATGVERVLWAKKRAGRAVFMMEEMEAGSTWALFHVRFGARTSTDCYS